MVSKTSILQWLFRCRHLLVQHQPNRPVLHLHFYNTGRIGQCCICIFTTPAESEWCKIICTTPAESASVGKASFLIALGDAVALRHAHTSPFLRTTQEAAPEGRRSSFALAWYWHVSAQLHLPGQLEKMLFQHRSIQQVLYK